jgi:hypothetical protein
MNSAFIFLLMIFCHIVDDYYLQGWLASAKQRKYWQDNAPDKLYRFDYIWALIMHSFSWAFMIMLPIALSMNFDVNNLFVACFAANVLIHAITDNEKANRLTINLWLDQLVHLCQIIITFIILV